MSDHQRPWLDILVLICRWFVGLVFLYASLDKIQHPEAFAQAIANYRLVPMPLLHPFAVLLPVVEALCGLVLLVGWQRRGAALLCSLMTLVFIVAIGSALARGLDISCGCFHTEGGHGVGQDLLIRDIGLLIVALVPLFAPRDRWSLDHWLARRGH